MKVFFMASPRAKNEYGELLAKAYGYITKLGHDHTSKFIEEVNQKELYERSGKAIEEHFKNTLIELKKSEVAIIDVSVTSMSMGFLIDKAIEYSKPLVILYTTGKEPFFFKGINDDSVQILEYDINSVEAILEESIRFAAEKMDTRFNFFISPKIGTYLDWVSKKKRVPRAVYLRRLIEEDMKKSKYDE